MTRSGFLLLSIGMGLWSTVVWGRPASEPVSAAKLVSRLAVRTDAAGSLILTSGARVLFKGVLSVPLPSSGKGRVESVQIAGKPAYLVRFDPIVRSSAAGRLHQDGSASRRRISALIVSGPRHRYRVAWSGKTGPMGPDGEYERRLTRLGPWVVLYQVRPHLKRCDGRPVRLFMRAYDPKTGRMRPVSRMPAYENVVDLTAQPIDGSAGTHAVGLAPMRFDFASTHEGDQALTSNLVMPVELQDRRVVTSWREGVGGAGRGVWLNAHGPRWPYALTGLWFVPGDAANARAFATHNRLRSFLVTLGSKTYRVLIPADPLSHGVGARYLVSFPTPVRADCVTVVVESVYPGSDQRAGGSTAIAEMHFLSELDRRGGLVRLARDVATGRVDRDTALAVLRSAGRALVPSLQRALDARRAVGTDLLAQALLSIDPATSARLVSRLGRLSAGTQKMLVGSLARSKDQKGLMSVMQDGQASRQVREQALKWAASMGAPVASVFVDWLDHAVGGDEERLVALGTHLPGVALHPEDLLVVKPARTVRWANRFWLAGLRVEVNGSLAGPTARLLVATQMPDGFSARYRYVEALGRCLAALDRGPMARQVLHLLASWARQGRDELTRFVAVRMLGKKRSAVGFVRRFLRDPAPRVRLAALGAVVQWHPSESGRRLMRCTMQDPWPWVRRHCSLMLAERCPARIGASLAAAVRKYGVAKTIDLLAVLARCRYPEAHDVFVSLARKRKALLSGSVIHLWASTGDPAAKRWIVGRVNLVLAGGRRLDPRQDARAADLIDALAIQASGKAVGSTLSLVTRAAAMQQAPRIQMAAARFLAGLCPVGVDRIARMLLSSRNSAVSRAGDDLRRRCAQR
ncbi:MAG: hypothetical protein J7M25_07165 [Deltaproteobacteria bacterium]|nr:hypothetical protein [Deltaproteobacteria bacterium]